MFYKSILVLSMLWQLMTLQVFSAPTHLVDESPVEILKLENGTVLIDFGRVAFGNLRLMPPAGADEELVISFGEAQKDNRIDRKPPGTVRFKQMTLKLTGEASIVAAPIPDIRNTKLREAPNATAVLTPKEWGVILPFRWVEIEGWRGPLTIDNIVRQSAYAASWDDNAANFESSDETLNDIWELCRYSIKATTFAGVYVDGDRERIPYEADAYLNQISHYYTDNDIQVARDTIDHLFKHPTWPTEWGPHMVFMVHADWMQTGDANWMAGRYQMMQSKLLLERRGEDNLVASNSNQIKRIDIVDWPKKERDGYIFTERNTVVNAFHLKCLILMQTMANVLGKTEDAAEYGRLYEDSYAAFQETFFDTKTGLYRDGVGTEHKSSHANLFPLAFGLVPQEFRENVANWLAKRGMRCSVYAAQYLMEGLFENGASTEAITLALANNDRSWRYMVESGTTITWEAWDMKYKPNQDWNHAWGAAPANLLPRYTLGVEAVEPGWKVARIRPLLGGLKYAKGKVPTQKGPVLIDWKNDEVFKILIELPDGMMAKVELPASKNSREVYRDGKPIAAKRVRNFWVLDEQLQGSAVFEVRP